jgi:hypothetical protein
LRDPAVWVRYGCLWSNVTADGNITPLFVLDLTPFASRLHCAGRQPHHVRPVVWFIAILGRVVELSIYFMI